MSDPKPDQVVHVYDDIQEEDNRLPNWWLATLFGTIIFGFGYWFVFQTAKWLPNPNEEFRAQAEELKKQRVAANPTSDEALWALAKQPQVVVDGQKVFMSTCVSCHGPKAEGLVGPNLTDPFWLHGNTPNDIIKGVNEGYVAQGMPPWGPVIGADKTRKVAAYVLSLRNTNVPGKAAQGERVE